MVDKVVCAYDDPLECLDLSVRVFNALRRSGVKTVGDLLALVEQGPDGLMAVRNFGDKSLDEVESKLAAVNVAQPKLAKSKAAWSFLESTAGFTDVPILLDFGPLRISQHTVVKWQQAVIGQQIRAGTLHRDLVVDDVPLADIVSAERRFAGDTYFRCKQVIVGPVSLVAELELALANLDERQLQVIHLRRGFRLATLEKIAEKIGVTRERVRQIENQIRQRIRAKASSLALIRIRSAILFADDMDLSFDEWSGKLLRTGLLGDWTEERFKHLDPIEMMFAVCALLEGSDKAVHQPESLKYMLRLRNDGRGEQPARSLALAEKLTKDEARLLRRHLRHSGAVSLDWLAERLPHERERLVEILLALDFLHIGRGWFFLPSPEQNMLDKNMVFHNAMAKMSKYCGELDSRDLMLGLEHALSRYEFEAPPKGVLEEILRRCDYSQQDTKWEWRGETSAALSGGETVILRTLVRNGDVAHHSQLANAFIESSLSFASLHGTLTRSPLFEAFDRSMYKLRGSTPNESAIERARGAQQHTPVNLSVERDSRGNITIGANLGTLAIGGGTITSENLPNLEGEWKCPTDDLPDQRIRVIGNEIRGLLRTMQSLQCFVGDRLELNFNTWTREVTVRKNESSI